MSERPTEHARVRNRWGEGERLRGEILEAGSRLLSRLGAEDAITIRGIAREVGIAAPSIYQHFSDRAGLIEALRDHEFDRLRTQMREREQMVPGEDPVGRVHALLHAYSDFAVANPGHYRLMLTGGQHRAEQFWDLIGSVEAGLVRCQDAGHALRLPSQRAAITVVVGVHGRVALHHTSDQRRSAESLDAFVDDLVSLVFA